MSIGQTLAAARGDARLTIGQVSAMTRIRAGIIEAIEADDFAPSGGDFYARGHIRAIARVVGVDPEPLISAYDAAHGGAPTTAVTEVFEAETHRVREWRGPNWSAAMTAAIAIVVLYGAVQLLTSDGRTRDTTTIGGPAATAPAGQAASAQATPSPSGTPTPSPRDQAIAAAPRDRVTVRLATSRGSSWVSARTRGDRSLYEGLVDRGERLTFTDRRGILLVIGNAGAVDLTVNGKRLGAPGGNGEVVRVTFTPKDPVSG